MIYLLDVIGAVGDSICTEPAVRHAVRCLAGEDIRIMTNHPQIFKHLKKPMGMTPEELRIKSEDEVIHIFNRYELMTENGIVHHKIIEYSPPMMVHSVDFASMLMLRRVLLDEEKRPHIEFDDKSAELEAMIGEKLENLVVIHAVGGNDCIRSLTDNHLNALLAGLERRGLKALLIWRDQKHFKLNPVGGINMINKLDWDYFITAIAKGRVLITNDSSPVHIASIFDNWLISLSIIKHPDRLVHPRHGRRHFKATSLYKKLTYTGETVPVTKYFASADWTSLEESREDYLADPEVIAEHAYRAFNGRGVEGINPLLD